MRTSLEEGGEKMKLESAAFTLYTNCMRGMWDG